MHTTFHHKLHSISYRNIVEMSTKKINIDEIVFLPKVEERYFFQTEVSGFFQWKFPLWKKLANPDYQYRTLEINSF